MTWGYQKKIISTKKDLRDACTEAIIDIYNEGLDFDSMKDLKKEVLKRIRDYCPMGLDIEGLVDIVSVRNTIDVIIHDAPLKCECGKDKHNFDGKHSDWCPKYEG